MRVNSKTQVYSIQGLDTIVHEAKKTLPIFEKKEQTALPPSFKRHETANYQTENVGMGRKGEITSFIEKIITEKVSAVLPNLEK